MGESSGKVRIDIPIHSVPRGLKLLVAVGGALSIALSIIYIVVLIYPQITVSGYINGYVSLTNYSLYYTTSGKPIKLVNLDTVKIPAVVTVIYIVSLLVMSLGALLYLKRYPLSSTTMVYGVSLSLVIATGVIRYLAQAFEADVGGALSRIDVDTIVVETLAGTIEFIGTYTTKTFAYHTLFTYNTAITVLLNVVIIVSTASTIWILYIYDKLYIESERPDKRGGEVAKVLKKPLLSTVISIALAAIVLMQTSATVSVYYPVAIAVTPSPPPIVLGNPPYSYVCTDLIRTSRTAIVYTDFETYPVSGWTSSGGTWSTVSGIAGAKGNVVQGSDNNQGVGGASHYYSTSLLGYSSLWTVSRIRWVSGTGYYGISMMNSGRNRLYSVEIYRTTTAGYLQIWSFNVESAGWRQLASIQIPGYTSTSWYILAVEYTVTATAISIVARVYSPIGSLLASTSASSTSVNRFTPTYIGIEVDDVVAYFDEFVISVSDPRNIAVTNLVTGMAVEVWDNLNNLVSSGSATGATLLLNVVHDTVVGTGADGRIAVRYPDGFTCSIYIAPDSIIGGDVYSLSTSQLAVAFGVNQTSALVSIPISGSSSTASYSRVLSINSLNPYYVRLTLDSYTAPPTLNLRIWLIGSTESTAIEIAGGVPIASSTNRIQLKSGESNYVALSGYFASPGQSATVNIYIAVSTGLEPEGAVVYYPITLVVSS